jgi:hypothetical protein
MGRGEMADPLAEGFRRLAAAEHGIEERMKRAASAMLGFLPLREDAELLEGAERISDRAEEISRRADDHVRTADQIDARASDS